MNAVWIWAVVATLFLLAEIFSASFFFLLWAVAAAGVAVVVLLWNITLTWQLFWFGVFSVPLLLLWAVITGRRKNKHQHDIAALLNQRGKQYIGREFELTAPVEYGVGKLQIGDTLWKLEGQDLPAGAKIVITEACGNSLSYRHVD